MHPHSFFLFFTWQLKRKVKIHIPLPIFFVHSIIIFFPPIFFFFFCLHFIVCCPKELKLKDEECERLSKVRDQLGQELEELTASLFEVCFHLFGFFSFLVKKKNPHTHTQKGVIFTVSGPLCQDKEFLSSYIAHLQLINCKLYNYNEELVIRCR